MASLLSNLRLLGRLATRTLKSGAVSIIMHPAVAQQVSLLRPSSPLRVLVGDKEPVSTETGRWRYVARLEMPPVLLSYESTEPDIATGTNRLTEVDEVTTDGQPAVTVVDVNSRLVRLELPDWLLEAHLAVQRGRAGHAPNIGVFERYRQWYRSGLVEGSSDKDPTEAIVRAAGTIVEGADQPDHDLVAGIVQRWLAEDGETAMNLRGERELDAAVLLATVVTMDFLGQRDQTMATGAVAVLHQLGRRALASVHTEPFAREWVARPERHGLGGAWSRLRSLSLARDLTRRQVRQLRSFCQAMLIKPSLRVAETDLAPIARALLAAIGDLDSAADILRDAETVAPLTMWGRILVPPNDRPTAQEKLINVQRHTLHTEADHVIGDALPITLLPTVTPPGHLETQLLRRLITTE